MPNRDRQLWPDNEEDMPPVHVAPGQVAFFPDGKSPLSWKDAERDPDHKANFETTPVSCSCGWSGESWVIHYTSVRS